MNMGLRPESASQNTRFNMYGAERGPKVYEKLFNKERSRLEILLFNNNMSDSVFMRDIRYLWTEIDILLSKSVKRIHTINWLKVSKKMNFMPKSIKNSINTLLRIGKNNHKIMARIRTMSYVMVNNMIAENESIRLEINRNANIT